MGTRLRPKYILKKYMDPWDTRFHSPQKMSKCRMLVIERQGCFLDAHLRDKLASVYRNS